MFAKAVGDRFDVIGRYLQDRSVLDIGCVDARTAREGSTERIERKPNLLFKRICQANPQTLGLDIDREGVDSLRGQGFNIICGDAETIDLERTFDTIIAGEIIEHLENPGRFLRNLHRHLAPAGVLILSTPNPFYCAQSWKIWRYGRPRVHEDHVNWHDPRTLAALLKRTGFKLMDGCWIQPKASPLKSWKRWLRPYFSHSFLCVAQRA